MIEQILEKIYQDAIVNDASATERDRMMLNITEETGRFLDLLVHECRPQRILEIGTSNGYSTIWLARAASQCNAKVVSVDFQAWKTELARRNLLSAELAQFVELHTLDACDFLLRCSPGEFDFIFLDADRSQYVSWAPSLFRACRFGTLVVDNATSHPAEISEFRVVVDQRRDLDSIVLPIGKGQLIIRSRSEDPA